MTETNSGSQVERVAHVEIREAIGHLIGRYNYSRREAIDSLRLALSRQAKQRQEQR